MHGIAFELFNPAGGFVDIGQQSARGLTVKANGRHKLVVLLDAPRPLLRIEFDPVVPFLDRRAISEMTAVALEIGHRNPSPRYMRAQDALATAGATLAIRYALSRHHE